MPSAVAVAALKSLAGTRRFRRSEEGQDLLEYGLLAALIAIVALAAVSSVGNTINTVFWNAIAASAGEAMRERAAEVGAQLQIRSMVSQGTEIVVDWPTSGDR